MTPSEEAKNSRHVIQHMKRAYFRKRVLAVWTSRDLPQRPRLYAVDSLTRSRLYLCDKTNNGCVGDYTVEGLLAFYSVKVFKF